jgi:hypothetical protein
MAGTDVYLGPPGAPVKLPGNIAPLEAGLVIPNASQEVLNGGTVVDRMGRVRRRYSIPYAGLTVDELGILERLVLLSTTLVLDDPNRRNRLTANQSSGGDTARTTDGVIARFQGSVAVSAVQVRSAPRSFAWATGTALAATGRGLYLYNSATVPDYAHHPVRAGAFYAAAAYLRASAAVSMQAGFDYHDDNGVYVSTSALGGGTAVSTANFNTRVDRTGVQVPAGIAYAIPFWINSTTTGAAITVYLDDPQVEEVSGAGVGCGAYVMGTGLPRVAVIDAPAPSPLLGYVSPQLDLLEV